MSFAVIKTGGKQYRVVEGGKLLIEKLDNAAGEEFDFDQVLMVGSGSTSASAVRTSSEPQPNSSVPNGSPQAGSADEVKIGTPLVEGAKVHARVLDQGRAAKKIVFKFHNKTRYKKKKGHRQPYTRVEILQIIT